MNISINSNIKQFIKVLQKEVKLQDKTLVSALNKTAKQSRSEASRAIREDYNITAADLNKKDPKTKLDRLGFTKANETKKTSSVVARGAGLPVKYFAVKQTAKGVTMKLRKDKSRQLIKSAFGPHIKRLGGHAFKRLTEKRLPIKMLLTTGVANMLNRKEVKTKVINYIKSNFARIYQNELRYFTQIKK